MKSSVYGFIAIAPSAPSGETTVVNYGGTTALGVYQNLIASNYFKTLANMYDQVRLDGCRVKITPTQNVLATGSSQSVFVSAWDRNGITNPQNVPSYSEVASYSSAMQKAVNMAASTWNAVRGIYATSIAEKGFFIPTSSVYDVFGAPGDAEKAGTGLNISYGQSLVAPWNPILLLGLMTFSAPAATSGTAPNETVNTIANTQTFNFLAEFEWRLTFRGLRFDVASNAAPIINASMLYNTGAAPNLGISSIQQAPDMEIEPPVRQGNAPNFNPPAAGYVFETLFPTSSTDGVSVLSGRRVLEAAPGWTVAQLKSVFESTRTVIFYVASFSTNTVRIRYGGYAPGVTNTSIVVVPEDFASFACYVYITNHDPSTGVAGFSIETRTPSKTDVNTFSITSNTSVVSATEEEGPKVTGYGRVYTSLTTFNGFNIR